MLMALESPQVSVSHRSNHPRRLQQENLRGVRLTWVSAGVLRNQPEVIAKHGWSSGNLSVHDTEKRLMFG